MVCMEKELKFSLIVYGRTRIMKKIFRYICSFWQFPLAILFAIIADARNHQSTPYPMLPSDITVISVVLLICFLLVCEIKYCNYFLRYGIEYLSVPFCFIIVWQYLIHGEYLGVIPSILCFIVFYPVKIWERSQIKKSGQKNRFFTLSMRIDELILLKLVLDVCLKSA